MRILSKNYVLMQLRPMSEEKESTIWILSRQQFPKFDHKWIMPRHRGIPKQHIRP